MLRLVLASWLSVVALSVWADIGAQAIVSLVPNAAPRGEATMRWFGIPLYDATLFTPNGQALDWQRPIALRLVYSRKISREAFLTATMRELDRIEGQRADHSEIRQKLMACYRDALTGDQFIAGSDTSDEVSLWFNGTKTCDVRHPQIRQRFLGIWLSDQSRSLRLTRHLRGD